MRLQIVLRHTHTHTHTHTYIYMCVYDLYCSHNILLGEKVEKSEMGGACSAYGGEEMCLQGFGVET